VTRAGFPALIPRCGSPNFHPAIKVRYITVKCQRASPLFSSRSSFGEAQYEYLKFKDNSHVFQSFDS
jgi:hypothetical protein